MPPHSKGLRIIFAGTPIFAAHHLQTLIDSDHQVVAVYTQPDRPAGRGKKLSASPVKALAQEQQLPVYQPLSLKDSEAQQTLASHKADIMIVVAYGLLLPQAVLDIPAYGCLNVHGSLLPRWRGAAPIQRAVAAGDDQTGITIMQMDKGLDTGDMLLKRSCTIDEGETSSSLHDKLMNLGAQGLLDTLALVAQGKLNPEPQDDSLATYAEKISKAEAEINWTESAEHIQCLIRAYNPFPVAYTFLGDQRIKCYGATTEAWKGEASPGQILAFTNSGLKVACGTNALLINQIQLPGKKPMLTKALLNGYSELFSTGKTFGR